MNGIYKPLEILTNDEINSILKNNDMVELIRLPLSVGLYHPNWKYAQDLCVKLSSYDNSNIRANAILGFAYIARTKGQLERHIVKPIILRELRENSEFRWRIIDSIEDINIYMNWNIGKSSLN